MNKEKSLPKNEIDTLFNVFVAYRLLITFITLISIFVSIIYALWMYKPVYSATALVQIGKVNARLITPTMEVRDRLLEKYEIYFNPNNELPKVSDIKIIQTSNGIIRVTAQGTSKEKLKIYLQEQINILSQEHNRSLSEFVQTYGEDLNISINYARETKNKWEKIKLDKQMNDNKINTFNDGNQTLLNLYMIKMLQTDRLLEHTYQQLNAYNSAVSMYKKYLLETKTFPTHIIDHIVIQKKPITPTRGMVIILGFISGLLFSLLMAFFLSFIKTRRR